MVDGFLRAYLVNRDGQEEALFVCRAGADLAPLATLRAEMVQREEDFDVKVVVTWGGLTVTGEGAERRAVSTDLTIAGTSNGQTQSRRVADGWGRCQRIRRRRRRRLARL